MVTVFLVCLVMGLASTGAGLYFLLRGGHAALSAIDPPAPAPVPIPVAAPRAVVRDIKRVTVRWLDPQGRVLGETAIRRQARRHEMKFLYAKRRVGLFTASHREGDIWIYRYLGDV